MFPTLNIIDFMIIFALAGLAIPLTSVYLPRPFFSESARNVVMFGAVLWILYSFCAEYVSEHFLGLWWMDAHYHEYQGILLTHDLWRGRWSSLFEHFKVGNDAYQCWCALVLFTGASIFSLTAINAFMALWGGLALASCFGSVCPFHPKKHFLLLFTIFCPSVIFWCTVNLKEGFTYWGICMVMTVSFTLPGSGLVTKTVLPACGVALGAMMRPHVVLGWVLAAVGTGILRKGKRFAAVSVLLCMPVVMYGVRSIMRADFNQDVALQLGESQFKVLGSIGSQGSKISYETGSPIFFVSGFVSAFFRPFPWKIGSLRLMIGALETWTMTLLIIYGWSKLNQREFRYLISLPGMHLAIAGSVWMCMLLTYFPNEGLMIRQRVQMIPGLLALAVLPILLRQYSRAWEKQAADAAASPEKSRDRRAAGGAR